MDKGWGEEGEDNMNGQSSMEAYRKYWQTDRLALLSFKDAVHCLPTSTGENMLHDHFL